jgi:hypothetical protein
MPLCPSCHHVVHITGAFAIPHDGSSLVPFFCIQPNMAAIHSHGWRFRLVRPDND